MPMQPPARRLSQLCSFPAQTALPGPGGICQLVLTSVHRSGAAAASPQPAAHISILSVTLQVLYVVYCGVTNVLKG